MVIEAWLEVKVVSNLNVTCASLFQNWLKVLDLFPPYLCCTVEWMAHRTSF
jgi:hypothetical protein